MPSVRGVRFVLWQEPNYRLSLCEPGVKLSLVLWALKPPHFHSSSFLPPPSPGTGAVGWSDSGGVGALFCEAGDA